MESLEEQLKCPVCLDKYNDPRGLPCLHSFCQACIEGLPTIGRLETGTATIQCPTCRSAITLPPGGVTDLPKAFHINTLLDLHSALNIPVAVKGEMPLCIIHNRVREFYCQTEDEVICSVCAVRGHREHKCDTVDVFFEEAKAEIETKFDSIKEQIEKVNDAIIQSGLLAENVKLQSLDVKKSIEQFEELNDDIAKEKRDLTRQVDAHAERRLRELEEKRDSLNTMLAQFQSSSEYVENTLKSEKPEQILLVRRQLLLHMNALIMHVDKSAFERKKSSIFFNPSGNKCRGIGNTCQVVFDDCYVSGYRRFAGNVGEAVSFFVHIKDLDGGYVALPAEHDISISPLVKPTSDSIAFSMTKEREGHYKISWASNVSGPHTVKCVIGGVDIPGSPFITRIIGDYNNLGFFSGVKSFGKSFGKFRIPCGIVLKNDGSLVVAERDPCSIVLLNKDKERIRTYGEQHLIGSILSGIALMRNGDLLAVDSKRNCLLKFSDDAQCQIIGSYGNGPLQFNLPYSVAVHQNNGKAFVTDRGNSRVHVLNEDLTFCTSFGSKGTGTGQFDTPFDIAIDSEGCLYVSDPLLGRIQKFSPDYEIVEAISLNSPFFLSFDGQDILYVMEQRQPVPGFFTIIVLGVTHNHHLTLINCRKGRMRFLTDFLWSKDCLDYGCTSRIAVDKTNSFLYITDPYGNCIHIL